MGILHISINLIKFLSYLDEFTLKLLKPIHFSNKLRKVFSDISEKVVQIQKLIIQYSTTISIKRFIYTLLKDTKVLDIIHGL